MIVRIKNAKVYDPTNKVDGRIKDIFIKDGKIIKRPNFILTPHVSWASMEAMQILSNQLIDNIENFVNGKPSNVVSGDF